MKNSSKPGFFIILLALCGVFALIYLIRGFLILLLLPMLFAYLLNPLVNGMERRGLSRGIGAFVVFICLGCILTIVILMLINPISAQVSELRENSKEYELKVNRWISAIETKLGLAETPEYMGPYDPYLQPQSNESVSKYLKKLFGKLSGFAFGMVGTLISLLTIVPIITFFLIKDGRRIRKGIISLVPNRHFERILIIQYEISQQIGKYLRGELTRSIIVGTMITIGLWLVDGPYPLLMGLFAGATNVIPFIGPYVGAAPALLVVLFTFTGGGPEEASLFMQFGSVAAVYLVSQLSDMMFINPMVMGKSVELHPLIIILSLLIGVNFLSVLGMVLAVPASSILKVILVQLHQSQRKIDIA